MAHVLNNKFAFTGDLQIESDENGVSYTVTNLRLWFQNRATPWNDKSVSECDFETAKLLFWDKWRAFTKRKFGYYVPLEIQNTYRF